MARYFSPLFKPIVSRPILNAVIFYKLVLISNKLVPVFRTLDLKSIPNYFLHLPRWLIFTARLLTVYYSLAGHVELDHNEPKKINSQRVSIARHSISRYSRVHIYTSQPALLYTLKATLTRVHIIRWLCTRSNESDSILFLKVIPKSGAISR